MADKLKVLLLVDRWLFASGSSALTRLAKFRNKEFFDIEFGAFTSFDKRRAETINKQGWKTHVFNGDSSGFVEFLKKEGVDVVHISRAGYEMHETIRAIRRANVPILAELNIFGLYGGSGAEEREIDLQLLQSKTAALRFMSYAKMGVNDFLRTRGVMYLPIDLPWFESLRPSDSRRDQIRGKLEIGSDAPLIIRVGRPDLFKWSFFSIHSFSLLVERIPETRYLVVGGIPKEVFAQIKKRGLEKHFIVLSQVPDEQIPELLYCADVLAHSSHIGESFGSAIAEAMAARKPVVVNSTDWADNAQIELVDHEQTGLIANTPRTYADSLAHLIRNRHCAEQMGEAGYRKAVSTYSASVVTASVEKSYADLADKKGIKPARARTRYYQQVQFVPNKEEIRRWPTEYQMRLLSSGYDLNSFQKAVMRKCWVAMNLIPPLRKIQIPSHMLATDGLLSYLAAVT